ncbi:MAG: hypothetical protein CGU29_16230 [Candidatus Dactylopiibacterium carminicum]|uniref:ATP synthase subunit I n=2 Tax=Candidatus Dactylopiibacterium carminicum TaxID=857335 RepID=A0A272EP67_9RHOO|nr:hypothetical protein BGI27_16265 [Candidatus Dactylopiibacterium carminicum]PAS91470.1 MAG: hypothetical protein CGU29_16230 [Candidatus Dactylopiibacterium carminicum]
MHVERQRGTQVMHGAKTGSVRGLPQRRMLDLRGLGLLGWAPFPQCKTLLPRWIKMLKLVLMQIAAGSIGVVVSGWLFGWLASISAAIGSGAVVLPNLLFAGFLSWTARVKGTPDVGTFLFGELMKLFLTLCLLIMVPVFYAGAHWGALIIGVALSLHALFLAFLVKT